MELALNNKLTSIIVPDVNIGKLSTMDELKQAEKNQSVLISTRTEFVKNFKPVKQAIDEVKRQALDFEKSELSKIEDLEKKNGQYISEFKSDIYRLQTELKNLVSQYKGIFDKCKYDLGQHGIVMSKIDIDLDRIAIQNSKETAFEKSAKLEELEVVEKSVPVVVENIQSHQIKPEPKVVLKKDEIKADEVFSIGNESAFIEWALQNDRSLIKIEIRLSEVKKFLSKKENQDKQKFPFLKSELKIK